MKKIPILIFAFSMAVFLSVPPLHAQSTKSTSSAPGASTRPDSTPGTSRPGSTPVNSSQGNHSPVSSTQGKRVTFPSTQSESPGNVLLVPATKTGAFGKIHNGKLIGPAVGTVTVPGGSALYLIVTPEGASRLACLKNLKPDDLWRIRLHDVPVTKETYVCLSNLTGLIELDLSNTDVDDAGVKVLSKSLTKISRLDLSRTVIRGSCFSSLSNCKELKDLDLAANAIEDFVLSALPKAVPNLEKLDLSKTKITDKALEHVGKIKHLKRLKLSKNDISDKGLTFLSKLSDLKKLDLEETKVTQSGVSALRRALPGCKIDLQDSD